MPDRRAVVTARPSAPRATLDDAVDYPRYLDVRLRRTPGKAVMTGRDVTRQWLRRHHADGPRRLPLPELVPSTFRVIEPGQRRAKDVARHQEVRTVPAT